MHPGKRLFFYLLLILSCLPALAQQPVYSFLQDDTLLRKSYYDQSMQVKDRWLASLPKANAGDYKKIYEEQFKEIGELWQSSRPVTAPAAQDYLQSLVQRIVAANPELKDKAARVVFTRDWWPNACSMGEGTIAINAGLLLYLDNEAELVFVLCHELGHYYLGHTQQAIKKYVETINSPAFQDELKRLSKTEFGANRQLEKLALSFAFSNHRHSRDNEGAADRHAFRLMKRTGYDCGAIQTCLEMLDRVDDSLLHRPLALQQVFTFSDYPFKKKWIQQESAIFSQLDDHGGLSAREKDSLKTHPDCSKRIALLKDSMAAAAGGKPFLVDEQRFRQLKKDFLVEITEQCWRNESLSRHLYYSLLMLQEGNNTPYAVYAVARCLNRLYEKQKEHKLGLTVDTESGTYPPDYNQLLRLLNRIRLDELAELKYQFCNMYRSQLQGYSGFEKEMTTAQRQRN
ncbi:MAG: M48 family metallopeptidase [Chitinophagaceae bacterium]